MAQSSNPRIAAAQAEVDRLRRKVQKAEDEGRVADSVAAARDWQKAVNKREAIAAEEADKDRRHNRKSK